MSDSAFGLWDHSAATERKCYGDPIAFGLAAEFLKGSETVEDWGCGRGYFKEVMGRVDPACRVVSIDGSPSRFSDVVADLKEYRSNGPNIFMRGVIEHNECWEQILDNACTSMASKFALVLFTPFVEAGPIVDLYRDDSLYIALSFRKSDITGVLDRHGLRYECEVMKTGSEFGVDILFKVSR